MIRIGLLAGAVALTLAPLTASAASAAPAGRTSTSVNLRTASSSAHEPSAASRTARPAAVYNSACGSGYKVVDSVPISTLGTVFLTYNSSTGYNCVVNVRTNPGTAMHMEAAIALSGDGSTIHSNSGDFSTYAGPVYIKAADHCVGWWGWIGLYYNAEYNSHCG